MKIFERKDNPKKTELNINWRYSLKLLVLTVVAFSFCLAGCGGNSQKEETFSAEASDDGSKASDFSDEPVYPYDPSDTWAFYWYLCGSDLESENGFASNDLEEMMSVQLPENISVIIQTGGATYWHNDIDPDVLSRFVYDSEGLSLIEELPIANMSDAETLKDFLYFCNDNYPADHKAVIFWDHGGGSSAGVIFDELHDGDSLSLSDIYEAFDEVNELSSEEPPYEIVGFDACLMASVDVAYTCGDIARYLIASEETEPGMGWNYNGLFQALTDNPGMNGAMLGKAICDSYYSACDYEEQADEVTLSVIDLSYADELMKAYNDIGADALLMACSNTSYFNQFGRAAREAENYGGNNKTEGYTNMVDLKDLVEKIGDGLSEEASNAVLDALDKCVVYQVNGPYRSNAGGLSCYYSYNGDYEHFESFASIGSSKSFQYFYDYALSGELSESGLEYLYSIISDAETETVEPGHFETPSKDDLDDWGVMIDEDGYAVLNLGPEIASKLSGVYFNLAYFDVEEDVFLFLGLDNDLYMNWEDGIFKDNFRGVWGSIDGSLVYMELSEENETYQVYAVPILLNGEEYALSVSYIYDTGKYNILGARSGIGENGMSSKNLRKLQPGDVVEPLHYFTSLSGDDSELEQIAIDSITVTKDTVFEETDLGDGTFLFMFEMVDAQNNSFLSEVVTATVEDGDIYFDYEL